MAARLIKGQSDFYFGLVVACLAVLFLFLMRDLEPGTASAMGPGYFPRGVTWLTLIISLFLMAKGILAVGDDADRFQFMPLACISFSLLAFALLVNWLGLFLTVIITVLIASLGSSERSIVEALVTGVMLAIGSCALFIWALGVPMKVFF